MIPPTYLRTNFDAGHRPPLTGLDDTGGAWIGASRVLHRAARRHQMKRSWARMKAEARRQYVAGTRGL